MDETPRDTDPERHARDRALVLAAAGIPYHLEETPDGWQLVVGAGDVERARTALADYEHDLAAPPGALGTGAEYGRTSAGLVMAALLVGVYAVVGGLAAGDAGFVAGSGSDEAIRAGEWWRVVTALTLHADASHLVTNVVSGAVLATAVCRVVGPGVGAWLLLLAGAGGNTLNTLVRATPHASVGASTAILGAVGVLAGLTAARTRRARAWVPLAAGLALMALLGGDERTDLGAHAFGFGVGIALGVATGLLVRRPASRAVQLVLAAAAAAVVAGCWLAALV